MSKKMIQLDPKFMNLSRQGGKSTTKKKRELLNKSNIRNTGALRKQLLTKIKDFQKKSEDDNHIPKKNEEEDFSGEFNKSLHFLNNLTSKHNKKNRTHKKRHSIQNAQSNTGYTSELENIHISTELPSELLPDSNMHIHPSKQSLKRHSITPQYSCLKNGSKPTYREWKRKTQKNYEVFGNKADGLETLSEREIQLSKMKETFQKNKLKDNIIISPTNNIESDKEYNKSSIQTPQFNIKIPKQLNTIEASPISLNTESFNSNYQKPEHRIRTTRYKLGKNKNYKLVGVLIKNRDTRRRISKEKENLKKKTIVEVKNYLKKCNLLKSGSEAPPDVLRTMYEQAILTGNVRNSAKDTLVHNYYNK